MGKQLVTRRVVGTLSILMMLALSGCFRQADEAFVAVTVTADSQGQVVETIATDPGSAPIAVTLTPSQAVDAEPTSTLPMIFIVTSSPTPDGFSPLGETQTAVAQPTASPTTGQVFITPGSPLQDLLILTNTPTLDPAASTAQVQATAASISTERALTPTNPDCIYIVLRGDSLYGIALRNDTTVEALKLTNSIIGELIRPGDELIIPGCDGDDVQVEAPTPTAQPDGTQIYTVRSGDSLSVIAGRFGVTVRAIMDANGLTDPDRLSLGQELIIPVPATTP